MRQKITQHIVTCLVLLTNPAFLFAANRYWVHKPFYENTFTTASELADWNLIEDNGTGSWVLVGDGTALLTMDDAAGGYANRLFDVDGGSPHLLPLDAVSGRVEIMVSAITGGNQRIFVQVEQFDASNNYLGQMNLLPSQSAVGFFSINLNDFTWDASADKVRFIIGGENYSGQQGTVAFDYFSYSNSNSSWNNTANWSATSGGAGGASVPTASDIAIFDGASGSNGSCLLTAGSSVGGIQITSNYSGNFDLEGFTLDIGSTGASIAGGGITGNGSTITIDGDVSFNGGTFSNASGQNYVTGDINITGGILDFSSGEVFFTGSNDQEFLSTLTNPINQLTINKPLGVVILNSDILVANVLSLTAGIVQTGSNTARLGISDSSPGQLNLGSGKIDGSFSRWVNGTATGTLLYPLGNATVDAPITLEVVVMPVTGGTCTITYNDIEPPSFIAVSFMDLTDLIENRSEANWPIQTSGLIGGTYSLSAANNHLGGVSDLSDLHLTLASSVVGIHVVATGILSNPLLQRSGLTAIDLANTWYASLEGTVLPLSWGYFKAIPEDNNVILRWSTFEEHNTSHFVIESAVEGGSFSAIGHEDAAGDYYGTSRYEYQHLRPAKGLNYYRLRQIDLDGAFTYSATIRVFIDGNIRAMIGKLVNPITDELSLTVQTQKVVFQVVALNGKVMLSGVLNEGDHHFDSSSWSVGTYLMSMSSESKLVEVYRMIKF
jgi:hypothetical protein